MKICQKKPSWFWRTFLRGKLDLLSPELLVYEVGNTLWKSVKKEFIGLDEALEKFSYFLELENSFDNPQS
ncbi:type II toxin-antitoxin system VapC family toxin [Candidatus Bathyarchaeota archaeon]|nr:type II toxin-antitoxin system VapC family toxin [Candidatus Bathyarchaeota archaeon]MBS7613823.1 type II toxin-antitoxin system VapC family toxin [Candidatus Bathyarchaeota archaeon]MBS7618517.1 type II toxin-antitoxin system VapC family toxin [Candidatus Bathyarchaeota archaeon]